MDRKSKSGFFDDFPARTSTAKALKKLLENNDKEKAKLGIDILIEIMTNMIDAPHNPRYKIIR